VIELGTKHFLGRAPISRKFASTTKSSGIPIRGFIGAMVNSAEYAQVFGEDTVPYRRFPTLPAATSNTGCNQLTKQSDDLVVPTSAGAAAWQLRRCGGEGDQI